MAARVPSAAGDRREHALNARRAARVRTESLAWPIFFGTFAVVATLAVLVGWNIIFTRHYLTLAENRSADNPGVGYWILLSIGDVALVFAIVMLIVFLVGNVRNVIELRRQTTFIDSIGHELRTPLASLRMGLDALATPTIDEFTKTRFLANMLTDVDRLERFINHVLHAGRIEHGEQRLAPQTVLLADLVLDCVEQVRGRHLDRKRPPHFDLDVPDEIVVRVDPHALQIAVLNVLDNAVKYSPEDPVIQVSVAVDTTNVHIGVRDHGAGLSEAKLRRIFNRFYRGDEPITRIVKGTGLGLHVSRELLRLMQGDLTATSEGVGEGSTFTIRIPRARPGEQI